MNSLQFKSHFQLMEIDPLIQELRLQLKRSKNIDEIAELRFKIYTRSNELKDGAITTVPCVEQKPMKDMLNFGVPIDAFVLRKKLA